MLYEFDWTAVDWEWKCIPIYTNSGKQLYAFLCYQYRNTTGPLEDLDESSALLQCYMILFRLFRNILFRKQRQSTTTTPTSRASLPGKKRKKRKSFHRFLRKFGKTRWKSIPCDHQDATPTPCISAPANCLCCSFSLSCLSLLLLCANPDLADMRMKPKSVSVCPLSGRPWGLNSGIQEEILISTW